MDQSAPPSQSNGVASGPPSAPPESGDFSFIVIRGSDATSEGWDPGSIPPFTNGVPNTPSIQVCMFYSSLQL